MRALMLEPDCRELFPVGSTVKVLHWFIPRDNRKAVVVSHNYVERRATDGDPMYFTTIRFPKQVLLTRYSIRELEKVGLQSYKYVEKYILETEVEVGNWEIELVPAKPVKKPRRFR